MTEYSPYEEYLGYADFEGEDLHPRCVNYEHPDDCELLCIQYCDAVGVNFYDFEDLEEAENWLAENVSWITEYREEEN